MPESITLTLPYPPAVNNLYFTMQTRERKIIRILTPRGKNFKNEVKKICQVERVTPFMGDVKVDLRVYRPRRIGDLDGTFKIIFDSMKGYAFNDDKQIAEITARRFEDKDDPRVEVEISPLGLC